MNPADFKNNKGQAVLLVLLGMAAVLTLVLSVVSKSVSDISTVSRSEDSSKAYSSAEQGIEALLLNPNMLNNSYSSVGVTATANKYALGANTADFAQIKSGQSDTIWFVSHTETPQQLMTCAGGLPCVSGNFTPEICWGNPLTNRDDKAPAIEVTFYFDTSTSATQPTPIYGGIKVIRKTYKAYQSASIPNFFEYRPGVCSSGQYAFSTGTIDIASLVGQAACLDKRGCLLFARVKAIYNTDTAHGVGIFTPASQPLPQQGWQIISTGTSGDATRRVETIRYFDEPLDIFDNAIMSFGTNADLNK